MERITASLTLQTHIEQHATLVETLVIALLVAFSTITVIRIVNQRSLVSPNEDLHLVRFGPYQKRYPIILPSFH